MKNVIQNIGQIRKRWFNRPFRRFPHSGETEIKPTTLQRESHRFHDSAPLGASTFNPPILMEIFAMFEREMA